MSREWGFVPLLGPFYLCGTSEGCVTRAIYYNTGFHRWIIWTAETGWRPITKETLHEVAQAAARQGAHLGGA